MEESNSTPHYPVKIKHHPQFSLILFVAAMVAVVICIFFYNVGKLIGIALVLGLPTAVPATLVNAWRFSKSTVITEETITIKRFGAIILKQYKMEDRREWREYLDYQGLLVKVFILRVKIEDEYLELKSDEIWNYEEVKNAIIYDKPKQDHMVEKVLSFEYGLNKVQQKVSSSKSHLPYRTISLFEFNKKHKSL